MDFSHLKKLEVTGKTARCVLFQVSGEPVLHVAPATEANRPYFVELLKQSRKNRQQIAAGGFSASVIKANRAIDRELYPLFIIKDWEGIVDINGAPVAANTESIREFVDALPDWVFDQIRSFAAEPSNFVGVSAEEIAGNS